ncbi:DUF4112 domain-containing protein [Hyphomonadaceae bacterium BL14]|nr:DUF4112 domain-containing protein [Hyphomonadaceae bacterium BL14]
MRALERLEQLARLMDSRFRIPGTGIRFGLDPVLGLVLGLGDALAALPALYILFEARRMGVPRSLRLRMLFNIGIDFLFGSIPILGSVFDVGFRANKRNVALLRRHVEERAHAAPGVKPAARTL